jgi:hypothetical protein
MSTLRHTEQMTSEYSAAESARVTPEELAQALAAVESRRAEEQQREADTIALGDAILQLDLNVTPEELLAEMNRQRQERQQAGVHKKQRRQRILVLGMALCASLLFNLLYIARSHVDVAPARAATVTPGPPGALPNFPKLSQVPDGLTVFVDHETLSALASGTPENAVVVDARQYVDSRRLWRLVKHAGKVSVQAFISEADALSIANDREGLVYATDPTGSGAAFTLTDVPLDRFKDAAVDSWTTDSAGLKRVASLKLRAAR